LLATSRWAADPIRWATPFSVTRFAGEVQWFPLDLWRFHLGAFGHGGVQYAKDLSPGWRTDRLSAAAQFWRSLSPRA